jgi:hypothetical protein
VLCARPGVAQDASGLPFLRIGPDAHAAAMGDARVALVDDAFSTYWNPAGLASAGPNQASLSHHIWFADVRTYALSSRFGVGTSGGLGLFVTATTSGEVEVRDEPGVPDGTFEAQYITAGLSYGRRIGPLQAGISAKYLSENIYTETASGYAFDFGGQASFFEDRLAVGATLANAGSISELKTVATKLPFLGRAGLGVTPLVIESEDDGEEVVSATLVAEVSHVFPDSLTRFHTGISVEIFEVLSLRGGYVTNDALRNVSLGLGFRYAGMVFDYALVTFDSGFEGPGHMLTLAYGW